jgi:hypothetical protein
MQQGWERGLLAERAQDIHLRGHARDHRVGGQEQQARVVPTHPARKHLRLEERRRAIDERLQTAEQAGS